MSGIHLPAFWRSHYILFSIKLVAIVLVVCLTNDGALRQFIDVLQDRRLLTATIFCLLWALALPSLLIIAFNPSALWRVLWGVTIATATAAGYGFYLAQGSDLMFFDALAFWNARHEVERAAVEYASQAMNATIISILYFVAIALPPTKMSPQLRTWLSRLTLAPILPIILIAGVIFYKEGRGTMGFPRQFSPVSLGVVLTLTVSTGSTRPRDEVAIKPAQSLARAIVLLVDESIRADHVSLIPENDYTPELAKLRERWVDFGPAVSGANCSSTSNAILRFMVDRRSISHTARTNPTIWEYARAAGFRTVYIDAQSALIRDGVKLQNFMTLTESNLIHNFHRLDRSIPVYMRDEKLLDLILDELNVGDKVFIMANKNGAHIPYEYDHPPEGNVLPYVAPTVDDLRNSTTADVKKRTSYINAVQWSVDRGLTRLLQEADLQDAVVIYTSDHGQNFTPGRLTHCTSGSATDPTEGIVPLMVTTSRQELFNRFAKVAAIYRGRGTHYGIPAALLELLGYNVGDVNRLYEESLLGRLDKPTAFVAGDIFGLLSDVSEWHQVSPELLEAWSRPARSQPQ
jgi:glucan phosphoethanolaminetransferase (alkaline phosphatase superfamily)